MSEVPETLGRYRLVERLRAGGMGEVYRAAAVGFEGVERPVAVKFIRPEMSGWAGLDELFVAEAKLSFQLVHPNIVQTLDMGVVGDARFLVMEYVEGESLSEILKRVTRFGAPTALHVAAEVARGLAYAHGRCGADGELLRIVHRDLSPGNVLLSRAGEVKVADFGIARSTLRPEATEPGVLRGKLSFMAPEQILGKPVDHRADLYALGVVLHEMVTGDRPEPAVELAARGDAGSARLSSDVPSWMVPLLVRLVTVRPEDRFADAASVVERIEALAREQGMPLGADRVRRLLADVPATPSDARPSSGAHPYALALGQELQVLRGRAPDQAREFTLTRPAPREEGPVGTAASASQPAAPMRQSEPGSRAPTLVAVVALLIAVGAAFLSVRGRSEAERGAGADRRRPSAEAVPRHEPPEVTVRSPASPRAAGSSDDPARSAAGDDVAPNRDAEAPAIGARAAEPDPAPGGRAAAAPPGTGPPARLFVNAEPWGVPWVDGRRVRDETPVNGLEVRPGRHRIRIESPGRAPRVRVVNAIPGAEVRVFVGPDG